MISLAKNLDGLISHEQDDKIEDGMADLTKDMSHLMANAKSAYSNG